MLQIFSNLWNSFRPILFPCLILLLSFALRLSLISKGPYHQDSLWLVVQAEKTLETGQLQQYFGVGFPLTVLLASLFIFVMKFLAGSDPVWAVNFMSVVLSSLGIFVFYFFIKRLLDERTAVMGALALSVNPLFLGLSVYGKNYMPMLFFLFLGLLFLLRFRDAASYKDYFISAVMFGCMGASRIHDLVWMFVPVSYLLVVVLREHAVVTKVRPPEILKSFTIFWLTVSGTILIFYLPLLLQSGAGEQIFSIRHAVREHVFEYYMGIFSRRTPQGLQFIVEAVSLLGIGLAIGGLGQLYHKRRPVFIFLLLWFIFPTLYYANLHTTLAHRHLLLAVPPLLIAQGFLISEIGQKRLALKVAAYGVFVIMSCLLLASIYPTLKTRHHHSYIAEFAQWTAVHTEPNAVIVANDDAGFFTYYGKRKTLAKPAAPIGKKWDLADADLRAFKEQVDQLLAQNIPVYITTVSLLAYDGGGKFVDFMDEHYCFEKIGTHPYEDWHGGELRSQIFMIELYRIVK
ncbi:MAG: hypothetical protein A2787_00930 [Omnitrophica WOR_2 bacterium RIFCSPHIGHO2_01_FULL_48_9]|nr:MAG: hypothetical protein A3D10_05840 [Omnitrophica WOR_2 bacterium RIFCSPHIGHO2_02_FULL_48_11]OGX31708.1 MAG: hypothetical protein A2787_00930 [Omnitrophica WOR_2 bacterium RIFCSPHIGHO2_01_FULL_48_9]